VRIKGKGPFSINKCNKATSFESLYDTMGLPNSGHYYWRIGWFKTDEGPFVITSENTKVIIKNLHTQQEVVAFNRILGVNYIITKRNVDGKISLLARLGFGTEQIDDVYTFFKEKISNQKM